MLEIDALVTAVQEIGLITGHLARTLDVVLGLGLVQQLAMNHDLYPTYPVAAIAEGAAA